MRALHYDVVNPSSPSSDSSDSRDAELEFVLERLGPLSRTPSTRSESILTRTSEFDTTLAHVDGELGEGGGVQNYFWGRLEEQNSLNRDDYNADEEKKLRLRRLLLAPEIKYEHLLVDFLKHRTISWDQTQNSNYTGEQLVALNKSLSQPDPSTCLLSSLQNENRRSSDLETAIDQRRVIRDLTPLRKPRASAPTSSEEYRERSPGTQSLLVSNSSRFYSNQRRGKERDFTEMAPSLSKEDNTTSAPALPSKEGSEIKSAVEELMRRLEHLEVENRLLKESSDKIAAEKRQLEVEGQTFHCFGDELFLSEPVWTFDRDDSVLRFDQGVRSTQAYLDQHPEVAFVNYLNYEGAEPPDENDPTAKKAEPVSQSIAFATKEMKEAVEELFTKIPEMSILFPDFTVDTEMPAPYLPFYYCSPLIDGVLPLLKPDHRPLIKKLHESVQQSHGQEYETAKQQFNRGMVSVKSIPFLIRPGQVLVSSTGNAVQAYMATTWPEQLPYARKETTVKSADTDDTDELLAIFNKEDHRQRLSGDKTSKKKAKVREWIVNLWCWLYNGNLEKREGARTIRLKFGDEREEIKITELEIYPLEYAPSEIKILLENRGRTFWRFQEKAFVAYKEDDTLGLNNIDERYMVDMATYKRLHSDSESKSSNPLSTKKPLSSDLGDSPPQGDAICLFPPTIVGFNMRLKKWVDLYVDRISDVKWNDEAFANLVIDPQSKELVEALVNSKLAAEMGTDLIEGKGNGLIILLHGGPGTGKTFTAEGVAEFARKPLYRVTCGDIGTSAEAVEVYLQSVLHLGKIWDCVVLLDEADVFLEERGQAELQRNALVSVFLRCLEYYDGILILTSNRVGTFDEAFKSRIQLALHYDRLTEAQRRKVWRNFLNRLRKLDGSNVDADEILDHVEDLGKHSLNGREIRNLITTARQLAQYRKQIFGYRHLEHVIMVASRFEVYLKDLREGISDDQIKREAGLR